MSPMENQSDLILPNPPMRIPTGFRPPAQGCDAGVTLGSRPANAPNPNGAVANPLLLARRNSVGIVLCAFAPSRPGVGAFELEPLFALNGDDAV